MPRNEDLTPALEDYLKAIWDILQDQKVARVKDIAARMGVNMASVTPAMRRLEALGLVEHETWGFVDLTPEGRRAAQGIRVRHDLLVRFLRDFLAVSPEVAEADACAIEHHISDETVDRLVGLLEHLQLCERAGKPASLDQFHAAARTWPGGAENVHSGRYSAKTASPGSAELSALWQLAPGESASVVRISAPPKLRRALIHRGFLPGIRIDVLFENPAGEALRIRVGGEEVSLPRDRAEAITVCRLREGESDE